MKNNQFQHFFNPNLCTICHLYKSHILCYTIYVIKRDNRPKKLKKPLDKSNGMCYNKYVPRGQKGKLL